MLILICITMVVGVHMFRESATILTIGKGVWGLDTPLLGYCCPLKFLHNSFEAGYET